MFVHRELFTKPDHNLFSRLTCLHRPSKRCILNGGHPPRAAAGLDSWSHLIRSSSPQRLSRHLWSLILVSIRPKEQVRPPFSLTLDLI